MRGTSWEYCSLISPPLLESFSTSLHHKTKVSIQWPSVTGSLQKSPGLTSCSSLFTPTVQDGSDYLFSKCIHCTHTSHLAFACFVVCLKQLSLFPSPLTKHIAAAQSCHLLQEAFLASYLLFLPCWATCLSSVLHLCSLCINFDCWFTGLPSPLDQSFPKFLNQEPHQ